MGLVDECAGVVDVLIVSDLGFLGGAGSGRSCAARKTCASAGSASLHIASLSLENQKWKWNRDLETLHVLHHSLKQVWLQLHLVITTQETLDVMAYPPMLMFSACKADRRGWVCLRLT